MNKMRIFKALLLVLFLMTGVFGQIIWHGDTASKVVYLTFDDGPDFSSTPEILKILKETGVKATFFVVGKKVRQNPSLLWQMVREGHEIANHTYSHSKKYDVSLWFAEQEIEKTNDAIYKAAKVKPKFFRPPFGTFNYRYFEAVWKRKMNVAFWTIDINNYKGPEAEEFAQKFCSKIGNGSIILLHQADINKPEFEKALYRIIKKLTKKGYKFKKLSDISQL